MKGSRVCNSIDASSSKKKSDIHSLPKEIITCILLRLPADVLYCSIRYVCREWFDIIQNPIFIEEHLLLQPSSLFIFQSHSDEISSVAEFGDSAANVTETCLPLKSQVCASCDGLVVVRVNGKFYVANLLTKQTIALPPVNDPLEIRRRFSISLVRGGSGMDDYRVVISYLAGDSRNLISMVITVGKDHAWKPISYKDLSDKYLVRTTRPAVKTIGIGGIVYWVIDVLSPIFALGNDMETFYQLSSDPVLENYTTYGYGYVGGKHSLSLVMGLWEEMVFDIWSVAVSHSGRCFEWRRGNRIDLRAEGPGLSFSVMKNPFVGVALLNDGEVVVLKDRIGGFVYHKVVETRKTFKFGSATFKLSDLDSAGYSSDFTYSLVRLTCS